MKILVTGGLGNLGIALIKSLLNEKNLNLIVLDTMSNSKITAKNFLDVNNVGFYEATTSGSINKTIKALNIDLIIHLAAKLDHIEKGIIFSKYSSKNNEMTKIIVDYCAQENIKLIYPSSTSVYHRLDGKVDETSNVKNYSSNYSTSKLFDEQYLLKKANDNLKYTILRLGSVHGYSMSMKFNTAVNKFCWNYTRNIPLPIWSGSLQTVRPYLSLDDFIRAVLFIIRKNMFNGQVYNLVTNSYSTTQIIQLIENCGGKNAELEYIDVGDLEFKSIFTSTEKIEHEGFKFFGSIENDIRVVLKYLS